MDAGYKQVAKHFFELLFQHSLQLSLNALWAKTFKEQEMAQAEPAHKFLHINVYSSLHSEACNAVGVSDGVIHSRVS